MSDFDADLMALLSPNDPSLVPAQLESQDPANAALKLDLASLLDPAQAEPVAGAVIDDLNAGQTAELPAAASHLAELAVIAARRATLEADLLDLYMQLDSAQLHLTTGLWAPAQAQTMRAILVRIQKAKGEWNLTDTEAWRFAYEKSLIPRRRPAGWTPFQLLEGKNP